MAIVQWLENHWGRSRTSSTFLNAPDQYFGGQGILAGNHYVRFWLSDLGIGTEESWFTTKLPVVFTLVKIRSGEEESWFPHVFPLNPLTSIGSEYPLTPVLPFYGGDIELEVGLLSVRAGNEIEAGFLRSLGIFSRSLSRQPLSSLTSGIDGLFAAFSEFIRTTNPEPVLLMNIEFRGTWNGQNELRPTYILVKNPDFSAALDDFSSAM